MLIFAMIILNLFIAVILSGFDKSEREEESILKPLYINDFETAWKHFDPTASAFIHVEQL
jgi:hypothetical protein